MERARLSPRERAARIGLVPGDRVAILAYNCIEWMEIYIALAKAGLVAVPINFRLLTPRSATSRSTPRPAR
jgi:acyl-CoA synthetase (AMP-forming)/AMP-acid ligase II